MSINIQGLNQYTQSHYGFNVCDWDNRSPSLDLCVLGKHDLDPNPEALQFHPSIKMEPISLEGYSVEQIGETFNKIFQTYQNCIINGTRFEPTSIYLRLSSGDKIPHKPFLFIAGVKKS